MLEANTLAILWLTKVANQACRDTADAIGKLTQSLQAANCTVTATANKALQEVTRLSPLVEGHNAQLVSMAGTFSKLNGDVSKL